MSDKILIVDDDAFLMKDLVKAVSKVCPNCEILEATNKEKAANLVNNNVFALIITDLRLEGDDKPEYGFEIVNLAKDRNKSTEAIVISSFLKREHYLNPANFSKHTGIELIDRNAQNPEMYPDDVPFGSYIYPLQNKIIQALERHRQNCKT